MMEPGDPPLPDISPATSDESEWRLPSFLPVRGPDAASSVAAAPNPAPPPRRRTGCTALLPISAILLLLAGFAAFWVWSPPPPDPTPPPVPRPAAARPVQPLDLEADAMAAQVASALPSAIENLAPDDAQRINQSIPLSTDPVEPAPPMTIPLGDGASYLAAVDCMTAAIYYEAASESDDGQRAVAQVVLNRVRHPAFPATVCGVVFQGAERVLGCQFSFACDGSLARVPDRAGWQRARAVAIRALAGRRYAPVGWATHYHADYVVPVWAHTFVKMIVIGRHIFYRWPGALGAPRAYVQRYAGPEQRPFSFAPNGALLYGVAQPPDTGADAGGIPPSPPTARDVLMARPAAPGQAPDHVPAAPDGAGRPGPGARWVIPVNPGDNPAP